jgi:hypothetical protein
LLNSSEIPIECGLVEIGLLTDEERNSMLARAGAFSHFDEDHSTYCRVTVPAPWRETPGPTWQFVAGMLRNQQRDFRKGLQSRRISNGYRFSTDLKARNNGSQSR